MTATGVPPERSPRISSRGGGRDFVSVEQVFGGDVDEYYLALRTLGKRYPGPQVDLTNWVNWFLGGFAISSGSTVGTVRGFVSSQRDIETRLQGAGLPRDSPLRSDTSCFSAK